MIMSSSRSVIWSGDAMPGTFSKWWPAIALTCTLRSLRLSFANLPPKAKIVYLNAWLQPENGHADVFFATSTMLERSGHYTNFAGVVSAFEACFDRPAGAVHAADLFPLLGATA